MKVFIRDTQTGWYYKEPTTWTPEQDDACDIGQVARAVERIFEAHLENVEILLSYDEPRYDLILPVPPSPSRRDSSKHRHGSEETRKGLASQSTLPPRKKEPSL